MSRVLNPKKIDVMLVGPMGAGKTTIARLLYPPLPLLSLASPIKDAATTLFGYRPKHELRPIYQKLGQMGRQFDEGFLTSRAEQKIQLLRPSGVVIDDGRTMKEIEWARSLFSFLIVYVNTPPQERFRRLRQRDGIEPVAESMRDETEETDALLSECDMIVDGENTDSAARHILSVLKGEH